MGGFTTITWHRKWIKGKMNEELVRVGAECREGRKVRKRID